MTAIQASPGAGPGRADYALILLTAVLTTLGLVAVWSASFVIGLAEYGDPNYFIFRQAIWAGLGTVLLVAAMRTDYHLYRKHALFLIVGTIIALALVLVVGVKTNGARRWLGIGEFTVQPAEFAKLTVIIYLAAWLDGRRERLRSFEGGMVPFAIIIGLIGGLIMLEPSLGTTLVIVAIAVTMFWVAGATWKQMVGLALAGVIAVGILAMAQGYRAERIATFFNADDPQGHGFQTLQALIALGNGGVNGLGLGASRGKFFYIPESHTDGVFAIIGEELGVIATIAVLMLYVVLMIRGYQVARRCPDNFGMLVATGITTWVTAQAFLNIGGITSMTPLTGVPLPFLSFGGNALAAVLLGMGVLIGISRHGRQAPAAAASPAPRRTIRRRAPR
jgi:cell division protein FtsW